MQDFEKDFYKEKTDNILIGKWKNEKMENKFNKISIYRYIYKNNIIIRIIIDNDDEIIQFDELNED